MQAESIGLLWTSHLDTKEIDRLVAEHHAIADAIVAEDGPAAGHLAEEHVRNNLKRLTAAHLALTEPRRRKP